MIKIEETIPDSWEWMAFEKILPSQLYLNYDKLKAVRDKLYKNDEFQVSKLEPVPIKERNGLIFYMDGHHTAFLVYQAGLKKMKVYWEPEEWNWELYDVCLQWCKDAGITSIKDLASRKIPNDDYQKLWIDRCQQMHQEIEAKHNTES